MEHAFEEFASLRYRHVHEIGERPIRVGDRNEKSDAFGVLSVSRPHEGVGIVLSGRTDGDKESDAFGVSLRCRFS